MLAFHSFPLKGGGGPKATSPGLSVLFLAWLGYQGHPPRTSGAWPASKLSAEPHYLLSLNFHSALLSRASVSIWDDPSTVLGATPQPQLDELLHGHPKKLSLHAASSLWLSILWGGGHLESLCGPLKCPQALVARESRSFCLCLAPVIVTRSSWKTCLLSALAFSSDMSSPSLFQHLVF